MILEHYNKNDSLNYYYSNWEAILNYKKKIVLRKINLILEHTF